MYATLYVALGGAIGASLRHGVGLTLSKFLGTDFPYATMMVNILGGVLMGGLMTWLMKTGPNEAARLFWGVGLLGGFTTFSAFSLDAVGLLEAKSYTGFSIYVLGSVALSILGLMIGLWVMRKIVSG